MDRPLSALRGENVNAEAAGCRFRTLENREVTTRRNSSYMVKVDRRPRMFSNPGTDLYEVSWVVDIHGAKVAGGKIEDRKFNQLGALKLNRLRAQLVFRAR